MNDAAKKFSSYKSIIDSSNFDGEIFHRTDFNSAIFQNVIFTNCEFKNCKLKGTRIYSTKFLNCKFIGMNFADVMLGEGGGEFLSCHFEECDLRRGMFYSPEFIGTSFLNCKFSGADLSASYFEDCRLSCKLENITFRLKFDSDYIKSKRIDLFLSVDFSNSTFGDFVTFVGCDLSQSIPPKGQTFENILHFLPVDIFGDDQLSTGDKDF